MLPSTLGREYCPWETPFSQWLLNAAYAETRRQQFIHTNWTNAAQVNALYESLQHEKTEPTFLFEGEDAEDIYKRYLTWVWKRHQAQIREVPGAQPRAAKHRNFVVTRETDWSSIEEVQGLNEAQKQLLTQWMFSYTPEVKGYVESLKENGVMPLNSIY